MGKTSAASKNKYNAKAYDRIGIMVPKGDKEKIQAHAQSKGESLNAFINRAIDYVIDIEQPHKSTFTDEEWEAMERARDECLKQMRENKDTQTVVVSGD